MVAFLGTSDGLVLAVAQVEETSPEMGRCGEGW